MSARFEVWQDASGEWRWRLVGANGETVAVGEGHSRERDAWRAAERVARLATEALARPEDEDGGDGATSQP